MQAQDAPFALRFEICLVLLALLGSRNMLFPLVLQAQDMLST